MAGIDDLAFLIAAKRTFHGKNTPFPNTIPDIIADVGRTVQFFSPAGFDGIRCCLLRRFRLKWEHYIYLKRRTLCLKALFALWGGLFILCAGLGFIPGFSQNVSAGAQAVLTVLAVAFFAPPACLIYGAKKGEGRTHTEAGARHFAAVAGADAAGTGAERAVRHGDGDHGKRVVRRADRGVQPHGLQRLLGAEPVPVGVSSDRQPLAAEEEF